MPYVIKHIAGSYVSAHASGCTYANWDASQKEAMRFATKRLASGVRRQLACAAHTKLVKLTKPAECHLLLDDTTLGKLYLGSYGYAVQYKRNARVFPNAKDALKFRDESTNQRWRDHAVAEPA